MLHSVALLLVAGFLHLTLAQEYDPLFWIYRLRHMEADNTGGDCPPQCDCPPTFPIAMYCNNRGLKQMPYIPSRMKYVYLERNRITTISSRAFGNAPNLVWVMLQQNQIKKIEPRAFANLVNLDRLYLSRNNLTEVPANLPRSLRDLRLNHNKIAKVSPKTFERMVNLVILMLNDNAIKEMGSRLKGLRSLMLLDVSSNKLKKVPDVLPGMIRQLYLDSNFINSIPGNFFKRLTSLQYVRLSHNMLTNRGIPPNTFNVSGLIELDLSFNKLQRIPSVSTNLQYLYLQANNIKEFTLGSFCSVVNMMNFSKLKVLRLEANEITPNDFPTESALCLRLASDIFL